MSKTRYLGVRVVQTGFLIWLVLTFMFFFFRLLPGDFASLMLLQGASPEQVAAFRAKWGLDDPLYVQYVDYMANLVRGDLGTSLRTRTPVWQTVKMGIFNSFILVGPGITTAYLLGSVIGTVQAINRDDVVDTVSTLIIIFIGAHPSFYIAIVLIVVFAGHLNLFPTGNMLSPAVYDTAETWFDPYLTGNFLYHYVLPFSAVVLRSIYYPALVLRTSMIEILGQDFIRYHRITGISPLKRSISLLKHSSLPLITIYPISMTRAIGGLVLIETVFNWPGIGFELVRSIFINDIPVVQFVFFLMAVFVILANFAVDILYTVIDPRVTLDE